MTNWTQRLAQKARNAPAVARRRTEPGLYDLSVRLRFWISPRQVQQWAAATKLFFVLGMGRSGTALLAQLLDQDPHAYVCHEPVRRDFRAGAEARTDSAAAPSTTLVLSAARRYSCAPARTAARSMAK